MCFRSLIPNLQYPVPLTTCTYLLRHLKMKNILSTIQASIIYCYPCGSPSPPDKVENTELQALPQGTIIRQPPTTPEPIRCPEEKFPTRSDYALDSLDVLWRNTPHPINGSTTSLPKTEHFRQTVALLDEFNVTYEVVKKIFEGLSHYSCHRSRVMSYYYRIRSFINKDSDQYFRYAGRSDIAHDADFDGVKFAVNSFIEEWGGIQELLADEEGEAERMIRLMTLDGHEEVGEAVPRDFM